MNIFWLDLLWFWMLYSRLRLRFVPRECIGPKFWRLKTNICVTLPALLCQLSQWTVSVSRKRFTTRAPSCFTCQRTSAHLPMKRALVSFTCIMGAHVVWAKTLISTALSSNFFASSPLPKGCSTSWYSSVHKSYLNSGFIMLHPFHMLRHTQALHTYRINLSPFTKDFRVWGAPIET